MNKMALFVLDQFKSDGLYTGVPQDDGTWYIDRTTITDEQYEQLKAIFESLNHLGRTSEEQKTKDEEAERKRKEAMEALERKWRTIR